MCYCTPIIRTPRCSNVNCYPGCKENNNVVPIKPKGGFLRLNLKFTTGTLHDFSDPDSFEPDSSGWHTHTITSESPSLAIYEMIKKLQELEGVFLDGEK